MNLTIPWPAGYLTGADNNSRPGSAAAAYSRVAAETTSPAIAQALSPNVGYESLPGPGPCPVSPARSPGQSHVPTPARFVLLRTPCPPTVLHVRRSVNPGDSGTCLGGGGAVSPALCRRWSRAAAAVGGAEHR